MDDALTALGRMATGDVGIVRRLSGGPGFLSRLAALGITLGAQVTMLQNCGHHGPLLVLVRDTRVALGRGEAMHVAVELAGRAPRPGRWWHGWRGGRHR